MKKHVLKLAHTKQLQLPQSKIPTTPLMHPGAANSSVPLATFRGGSGGALAALGAAGWAGGGLLLRMAPYVSFCKMLGTKLLCLSLARLAASLARDAALDCSWLEPSW